MLLHQILQPEGWAKPRGYANGVAARGKQIFVAGQIGWDGECRSLREPQELSRLEIECCLSVFKIGRHGDVVVHDQPLAVYLSQAER